MTGTSIIFICYSPSALGSKLIIIAGKCACRWGVAFHCERHTDQLKFRKQNFEVTATEWISIVVQCTFGFNFPMFKDKSFNELNFQKLCTAFKTMK